MKKILMILSLVFMLTSCGSYVNTTYTEPQETQRSEYKEYFSSMQNQNFDNIEQENTTNISVKIFITSKTNLDKEILIFDVLGKKVFQTVTSSKEVNINAIPSGVYIIKITEGENTTTRKLIVR